MEKKYKHLTATDRGMIEALILKNYSISEIARELGASKSTVSRELAKRKTPNGYKAWVAELNYEKERRWCKKRKKHTGRCVHRSKIPNRISIHKRPKVVDERIQYRHCEADSVIYPYKQAISTVNELVTGKVAFTLLERKTANLTKEALLQRLTELRALTLTVDNGLEFARHENVTRITSVPIYFADIRIPPGKEVPMKTLICSLEATCLSAMILEA